METFLDVSSNWMLNKNDNLSVFFSCMIAFKVIIQSFIELSYNSSLKTLTHLQKINDIAQKLRRLD